MAHNGGNHGPRHVFWRAWCHACKRHLAMLGRSSLYPDELRCPTCGQWRKVMALGRNHLMGDILLPTGSGRGRVVEP